MVGLEAKLLVLKCVLSYVPFFIFYLFIYLFIYLFFKDLIIRGFSLSGVLFYVLFSFLLYVPSFCVCVCVTLLFLCVFC